MIPYSRQSVDEADIIAVAEALRGDLLTTGPHVDEFEASITDYTGAQHAIAFANGTAALHACMHAAEIGPADVVASSPLSFSASVNCATYVGARVAFADIDPATLNLDPSTLPPCDALVAVHYSGLPFDLTTLTDPPRVVVEDAAQALGARTPDGPVGNCAHSDMTVFSFHPVKSITSGEGGIVTTNNDRLAERLRAFRSHGIVSRPNLRPWEYDIEELGFNYRLSDIHAALGRSQMRKLEEFVLRRNELAGVYDAAFEGSTVEVPPIPQVGFRHARHLYPVRVDDRDQTYARLRREGIGVQVHHVPIYRLSVHADVVGEWPQTDYAYSRLLSLPLHPELDEADQTRVICSLLDP